LEAKREVAGGAGPVVEAPSVADWPGAAVLAFAVESVAEVAGFEAALEKREPAGAAPGVAVVVVAGAAVDDDDAAVVSLLPKRLGAEPDEAAGAEVDAVALL